ncbi:MAG: hypothetical protein NVS1B10_07440 [Candidatus Saccharimonadales bacterium]
MSREIYFVPHGPFKPKSGKLKRTGREDAKFARDMLIDRGIGSSALILTSIMPPFEQTAKIINRKLDASIYYSDLVHVTSNDSTLIKSKKQININTVAIDLMNETPEEHISDGTVVIIVSPLLITRGLGAKKNNHVLGGEVHRYHPIEGLYPLNQIK